MKKLLVVFAFTFAIFQNGACQASVDYQPKRQKQNVIKINLHNPFLDHLTFGYERALNKGVSIETKLGIAGVIKSHLFMFDKVSGLTFKLGLKFKLSPDNINDEPRGKPRLWGAYLKPEFAINRLKRSMIGYHNIFSGVTYPTDEEKGVTAALFLNLGKQWVFGPRFTVDISAGLGFGYSTVTRDTGIEGSMSPLRYGFLFHGKNFALTTTATCAIGYAF